MSKQLKSDSDQTNFQYPNVVYYNDDHSHTPECTGKIKEHLKITYSTPSTWSELAAELETGAEFLCFHIDMIAKSVHSTINEFVDAIITMTRYIPNTKKLKIFVLIKPTTSVDAVRTLQKAGVHGIGLDLNYYPIEEVAFSANALVNGIPYWPKHIIDKLPGAKKKKAPVKNIELTGRQAQVFRLITERGSSNKHIAKALGISESTVKLHVTEIFKKYGVRNRTQLAVFSNAS